MKKINSLLLGLLTAVITFVHILMHALVKLAVFAKDEINKIVVTTVRRMKGGYYCGLLSFALYMAVGNMLLRWPKSFGAWLFVSTSVLIFASYFLTIIYNSYLWKEMPISERCFKAVLYCRLYLMPMAKGTFIGLALLHHV